MLRPFDKPLCGENQISRLADVTDPPEPWDILTAYHGHLAFDVGANIGQASRVLAPHFLKVVAFEPCIEAYKILRNEAPGNVKTRCMAVSDRNGTVKLTETAYSITTGQLTTGEGLNWGPTIGHRSVPSITLDSAALVYGAPDLIKIDVEGHEVQVIRGGEGLWTSFKPKVFIEIHKAAHGPAIRKLMPGYEFDEIEHPYYRPGDPLRGEHYWLVSR